MDFIPKYIAGKKSGGKVTYDTPLLQPILQPTYGCIVYQEQVMQIVRNLGGYSLGRADLVRRAMSKKKERVMQEERRNFVYGNPAENVPGCAAKGIDEKMIDFARYAFNKSHAACYAVVTYQTAWLKYYYPTEFMAAILTSVIDFPAKVAGYILTCRSLGIRILPPDINEGEAGFSVADGAIRYALTAVKGVGRPVIDAIVKERNTNGRFRDLQDFIARTQGMQVSKRVIESFIKAGAFDSFGVTRKQMMSVYIRMVDEQQASAKNNMAGQLSLFDLVPQEQKHQFEITYPDIGEYDKEMLLSFEKEVLGIYVSGHPLEEYEALWKGHITNKATDFYYDAQAQGSPDAGRPYAAPAVSPGDTEPGMQLRDGQDVVVGGLITDVRIKYTKNNQVMAFVTMEDLTGDLSVTVFPKSYEKYSPFLKEDAKIFVRGRVSLRDEQNAEVLCSTITPFDDVPRRLWIRFHDMEAYTSASAELLRIVDEYGGRDQVVIYVENPRSRKVLPPGQGVRADKALLDLLRARFGNGNVTLA